MPLAEISAQVAGMATVAALGLAAGAYVLGRSRRRRPPPGELERADKLENYQLILDTLDRSNVLLWWARVTPAVQPGTYDWQIRTPPQLRDNPIYRLASLADKGWLWKKELSPDHEAMDRCSHEAIAGGKEGYQHEFRIIGTDGVHWLSEEVIIRPSGPAEWNLAGVVIDVTKRREAEEARRSTESQLEQILKGADCLIWQAEVTGHPDTGIVWRMFIPPSVLFRKIFGEDSVPRSDRLWSREIVPEWEAITQRSRQALREGRPDYEQEYRVNSNGATFMLHEHVALRPVSPGKWILVGVIVDVTARREAELALAAEKERLSVTLGSMREGVITIDALGRVLFMNRAASEMTQWVAAEAAGRDVREVCSLRSAGGAELVLPVRDVLEGGGQADLAPQTLMRGREEAVRMVEGRLVPVTNPSGGRTGAVLVFRDITERHRMEETLQNAAKMESVGILAGGIAHDFNNILTAILSNLSLLQLDLGSKPDQAALLKEAIGATKRAADLTLQLLTFAKGGDPVRTAVHLQEVVREAATFSQRGSGVRSEFEMPGDLWAADVDKAQISQVIQNLVINATQAMATGGVLRVTASNQRIGARSHPVLAEGNYVRISVADTGEGIPPEHLGRIFDPYFTTKLQGHGLGLATVFSIIRRHQGHIEVESAVGSGSTFTIWLPAAKAQQPDPPAARPFEGAGGNGRILFMDDEEPILNMARRLMKRMGYEVETVLDGQAAVDSYAAALAQGRPFSAVVMDLTIPGGMGGKEAICHLHKLDPKVKAIVSSGYSSDLAMSDFRKHGFRGMVAKPYDISELAAVIRSVIAEEA